jgi:O-antigen/teichoic acid export membrane protein
MVAVAGIAAQTSEGFDWLLLAAGVMLAITQGATTILASVFRARGQAGRFALATGLLVNVGRAAVAALALAISLGAAVVLWAFVALNLVVILMTWAQATRGLPDTESAGDGDAALHLGGAGWSLLANLDVIVVGLVLGATLAGTYGASMRIAEFSSQFLVAISVLYLPEATRLAVAHRRDAVILLYRTACRWSALTSLLIAGTGFIVADRVADLLFPEKPVAATLLRILFVGYGIHGAMGSNYGTLVALAEYTAIKRCAVALLILVPSLTVAFCLLWGVTGAAWATATCYTLLNVYLTAEVRRALGVLPFDRLYWRAVAACAASWLVAAMTVRTLQDSSSATVLIAAGSAAALVCIVLVPLLGAVSPRELDLMRRLRRRSATDGPVAS